jgi:hypothetical protein
MKHTIQSSVESRIEELRKELVAFREKEGRPKCHPSKKIWNDAVELCKVASVKSVAEGISVSPSSLQNRIKARAASGKKKASEARQPQFLEVRGLQVAAALPPHQLTDRVQFAGAENSRQVELMRGDGSCLKITDLGAHGIDLRALVQGFMAAPPPLAQMEGSFR